MVFQFAFVVLFNGVVGASTPLPRQPIVIGPFAANCSQDAYKACETAKDDMLTKFPHSRLVTDCFATQPLPVWDKND